MRETILIIALLLTLTLINFIYNSKAKKELNYQINQSQKLITLANKIKALTPPKITPPSFCKQNKKILICNNLNKAKLYQFENFLSKAYFQSFEIEKNKTIKAKVKLQ